MAPGVNVLRPPEMLTKGGFCRFRAGSPAEVHEARFFPLTLDSATFRLDPLRQSSRHESRRHLPVVEKLREKMDSFEEMDLSPELVDALAAEGIERPTEFQEAAIPVIRRGNNLAGHAGPGAGSLVAYGAGMLDRLNPEGAALRGLVLVATRSAADRLAQSLARLAQFTGHRVAALGGAWALPAHADVLFSTPRNALDSVKASEISLDAVEVAVVDGFAAIQGVEGLESLETLAEFLPKEAQRVVLSLPYPPEALSFEEAHLKKTVHLPPRAAHDEAAEQPPRRGEVRYRISGETKENEVMQAVSEALHGDVHHVVLFFRSDDRAADIGDFLAMHGYLSGPPGDTDSPVWLAVDEMEARDALAEVEDQDQVALVSFDVPADPDSLDRRHGSGGGGTILVLAREFPHLKDVAARTGYRLIPAEEPMPTRMATELERLRGTVERALGEEELAPHLLVLEPLFERHAPAEVAAAAFALLKRGGAPRGTGDTTSVPPTTSQASGPKAPAWVRLFISVGSRDGIGPGDLLGAVTGEAGIEGAKVGKIDLRDTFSIVEVQDAVAQKVIKALNGKSLKGRSIRADFDRASTRGRGGGGRRPDTGRAGRSPGR